MRFRYVEWNENLHGQSKATFDKLFDLFQQLLMYTAGDAAEALQWLTQLDRQYGLTDDDMGMGDFIEELKNRGYLEQDQLGQLQITSRSERSLRQRSLEEIFRQLRKGNQGSA